MTVSNARFFIGFVVAGLNAKHSPANPAVGIEASSDQGKSVLSDRLATSLAGCAAIAGQGGSSGAGFNQASNHLSETNGIWSLDEINADKPEIAKRTKDIVESWKMNSIQGISRAKIMGTTYHAPSISSARCALIGSAVFLPTFDDQNQTDNRMFYFDMTDSMRKFYENHGGNNGFDDLKGYVDSISDNLQYTVTKGTLLFPVLHASFRTIVAKKYPEFPGHKHSMIASICTCLLYTSPSPRDS